MTKEQEEFMIKDQKLNELCEETRDYGRMQFIDRIADLEIDRDKLIKYLEDKIKKLKDKGASYGLTIDRDIAEYIDSRVEVYQYILERVKCGNYE